jgi:hypothetical protein
LRYPHYSQRFVLIYNARRESLTEKRPDKRFAPEHPRLAETRCSLRPSSFDLAPPQPRRALRSLGATAAASRRDAVSPEVTFAQAASPELAKARMMLDRAVDQLVIFFQWIS